NVSNSRRFYEGLGFRSVEGSDADGWAVVVNADARIGLFEARYMSSEVSLNFRGGDVQSIVAALNEKGYQFERTSDISAGASAELKDPDGHMIFFDAAADEAKKV